MRDASLRIVERALAAGSEAAEIYTKRSETSVWHYSPATGVLDGRRGIRGVALRLFRDGGTRFLAAPEGDPIWEHSPEPPPPARPGSRVFAVPATPRIATPLPEAPPLPPGDSSDRRSLLRAIEREVTRLSSGSVRLLSAELEEGAWQARLMSSGGVDAPSSGYGFHLVLRVTGEHDGRRLSAVQVESGRETPPPTAIAARAVDRILYPLRGRDLPEKKGEILLDPAVATAVLAGISAAFVAGRRPTDWPSASLGRDGRWGSPALSIVDDGRLSTGPNPQAFDGEGWPHRRRVVLDEGRLGELLTDAAESARLGRPSTGNATRDSWREPPAAGASQCYIEPQAGLSPADLLGSVRSGYYLLATAGRGEFDLVADRFSLPVSGAWLLKGRARYPIRPSLLAGKISELLRSVKASAGEVVFHQRDGWFGAPTILLGGFRIS